MILQSYKILLNNRNETILPTLSNDYSGQCLKPGDLIVYTCSRIKGKEIYPAIYLGSDPKDNTKLKYLVISKTSFNNINTDNSFQVSVSKTAVTLKLNWEVQNRSINTVAFKVSQEILNRTIHINLDEILKLN